MDYCSIDSEVIESLDYLRPPVKRLKYPIRDILCSASRNNRTNDIKILNSPKRKVTKYENSHFNKTGLASSTSLILQKTSERNIIDKYSIISYTDILHTNENPKSSNQRIGKDVIAKNKPLINVTVIPKTEDPQARLMRKRRQIAKRVHTTVSNQESSIRTKNVYLVVAGRRKEKVYEIKTTGSAKLCNDHPDFHEKDGELSVKELPNLKYFINSLNMDKNKKKNRKKKEGLEVNANNNREVGDIIDACTCSNARNDVRINLSPQKSRITIYGRVGRTEDDKYVMNCSATVDNKPVPAQNYVQVDRTTSRFLSGINKKEEKFDPKLKTAGQIDGNKTNFQGIQTEFVDQTGFPDDNTCYKLMDRNPLERSPIRCKESHATQVDFQISSTNDAIKSFQNQEQNAQRTFKNGQQLGGKYENNNLKVCQSPFVIISVYPKQESLEIAKPSCGEKLSHQSPTRGKDTNNGHVKGRAKNKKDFGIKANNRSPRNSRSPSPRPDNKTIINSKAQKTHITSKDTTGRRIIGPEERTPQQNSHQKQNYRKTKFSPAETTMQVYRQQTKTKKGMSKTYEDKGTNTDHWLTKKALVDQYTKEITSQIDNLGRDEPKRCRGSKVIVNIYGENERNALRFNNPEKRVLKSTRANSPPQYYQENINSMENFLIISEDSSQQTRSPSTGSYKDWPTDDMPIKINTSRIQVRDSLEICHRREDPIGQNAKRTQTSNIKNGSNDTKYLAPIKHYTGDKCAIPNPVARDKEIRELLGVNKNRATPQKQTLQTHTHCSHLPVKCYYQETSEKNVLTGFTVLECPCKCCQQQRNNERVSKRQTKEIEKEDEEDEEIRNHERKLTQNDKSGLERTSLYQQMILNRNIQVFLQVEQFTKQKPIILSRQQYDKVKKTIEETISKTQHKRKSNVSKGSIVSVGEVRKKSKREWSFNHSKKAQANFYDPPDSVSDTEEYDRKKSKKSGASPKKEVLPIESNENSRRSEEDSRHKSRQQSRRKMQESKKSIRNSKPSKPKNKVICVCAGSNQEENTSRVRQTMSSMEIRYASVAYLKHISFSSTNVENVSMPLTLSRNNFSSLYTIFKGHRKAPTPNLGTSAFSLYSETNPDSKVLKILMPPRETKPKKPFLKRLMSCLVMRSTRASDVKTFIDPAPLNPSANSSIDSYHFSSSLGAVEISSSLYDTSASFYSSHSIHPITSKMKRGFFSSVRGFLNRKS